MRLIFLYYLLEFNRAQGSVLHRFCILLAGIVSIILSLIFIPLNAYAEQNIKPPLTAHSNSHNVTTHGGLTWTPDSVLGNNILIINSSHESDTKTSDLMKGIYEVFNNSEKNINIYVEYMDTKRYKSSFHKKYLTDLYKYKYTNKRFGAVIVSGIEALEFVKEHQSDIFQSMPVIYCGINVYEFETIKKLDNSTGVLESSSVIDTIKLALELHPDIDNVLLLSPGKQNTKILTEVEQEFKNNINLDYWYDFYNSDIESKIEALQKDYIIIPLSEPITKSGSFISYTDFIKRITKITHSPVYSLWEYGLGSGAIGGKLISSVIQGNATAEIALQLLNGKDINTIPVRIENMNKYMFDYSPLKKYSINLNNLPPNSIIINNPFSIYHTYKTEINTAVLIVLFQALIIFLLFFANKRRKKAENDLRMINDELEIRVLQRTNEITLSNELLIKEIEERKLAEQALSISEEKFSKAFRSCPDGITITRLSDDRLIEVNDTFIRHSEYSREEIIGKTTLDLGLWCNSDERQRLIEIIKQDKSLHNFEAKLKSRTGIIYDVLISAETIVIANDLCLLTIARDISEHKRINTELRRYEKIVSSTKDCMSFIDTNYVYQAVNKSFLNTFNFKKDEILGHHITEVYGNTRFNKIIKPHLDRCLKGITVNIQDNLAIPKHRNRFYDILYSPYYENEKIMGVVITARDMTHTYELSSQLAYQASHDELTGLINRREFEKRLQKILDIVKTNNDEYVLCYIDLDQFKVINDNCGHAAGDELLRQLGKILTCNVRKQDTLARLGGDEFAAIIENCTIKKAKKLVDDILTSIDNFRFEWENKTYRIGASIGLVPITHHAINMNELLKQADAACYVAKNEGRNRIHLYKQNDAKLEKHHFEMQGVLHVQSALDENRLCLFKQQIVPINKKAVDEGDHYEILLRLQKDGEILPPKVFLPAAEQYGLSSKIDAWVVNSIFTWLTDDQTRQDKLALCSINLSAYSLSTDGLLDYIISLLDKLPIIPEKICFEITETATIANYDKALHFIKELRNRGCKFALDDFGSGFSSFAYLKTLKVDYVKIDGMFIRDILADPIAFSMVKSINEIGHIAGIKTIAEFVENELILDKVKDLNIDFVQGHAIGLPQPIDSFIYDKPIETKRKFIPVKNNYLKH